MRNARKIYLREIRGKKKKFNIKNYTFSNTCKITDYINVFENFMLDGFIVGVCIKGNVSAKINNQIYEVNTNRLVLITPYSVIKVIDRSEVFSIKFIFFSIDYFFSTPLRMEKDIFVAMNRNPIIQLNAEAIKDIIEQYRIILKHQHLNLIYGTGIVNAHMSALMLLIASHYNVEIQKGVLKQSSREDSIAKQFIFLLLEYFLTEKKLTFYANKLCLTPNYLSSIIKEATGSSFQKWIQTIIIIEAENLLKTTNLSIIQISEYLNFANPSFFGRFFKQWVGVTPLQYRKSYMTLDN